MVAEIHARLVLAALALLVSDDKAGAIYRISYQGK